GGVDKADLAAGEVRVVELSVPADLQIDYDAGPPHDDLRPLGVRKAVFFERKRPDAAERRVGNDLQVPLVIVLPLGSLVARPAEVLDEPAARDDAIDLLPLVVPDVPDPDLVRPGPDLESGRAA